MAACIIYLEWLAEEVTFCLPKEKDLCFVELLSLSISTLHSQVDRHHLFLCVWNGKSKVHRSTVESGNNQVFSLVIKVLTGEVRRRGWFQTRLHCLWLWPVHTWNSLTLRETGKIHAIFILLNALNLIQITLASFISPNDALGCHGSSLGQDCSLSLWEQMIDYSNQKDFLTLSDLFILIRM